MRSKTVAELFDYLDIARSHSRPRVSNDNPYSEAAFKTLKYHWSYPGAFAGVAEGREYFALFFRWYNNEHRHSGIAYLTPDCVHEGRADVQLDARQRVLDAAYTANPERFGRAPKVPELAREVWINPPSPSSSAGEGGATVQRGLTPVAPAALAPRPGLEPLLNQ